jgi:hypothetical protein
VDGWPARREHVGDRRADGDVVAEHWKARNMLGMFGEAADRHDGVRRIVAT